MAINWNLRHEIKPAESTSCYTSRHPDNGKDILKSFKENLQHNTEASQGLDEALNKEQAILRLSLNNNIRFRKETAYHKLRKVISSIRKHQDVDLVSLMKNMKALMPSYTFHHTKARVPRLAVLLHFLSRCYASFQLLLHIDGLCLDAAFYTTAKIKTGHFHMHFSALLACTARIRAFVLDLANITSSTYNIVRNFVEVLDESLDSSWKLQFSRDLEEELKEHVWKSTVKPGSQVEVAVPLHASEGLGSNKAFIESSERNYEKEDTFINISPSKSADPSFINAQSDNVQIASNFVLEDLGLAISDKQVEVLRRKLSKTSQSNNEGMKRESLDHNLYRNVSNSFTGSAEMYEIHKKLKKLLKTMKGYSSIRKFVKAEQKLRKNKSKLRTSNLLSNDQWAEFKKCIDKRIRQDSQIEIQISKDDKIKKIKSQIKFWLLFPDSRGRRPDDWASFLKLSKF